MATFTYAIHKCDHGDGMNWCVLRHEWNEHGGDVAEVVRYTHTRALARAFVAASTIADAIPGAMVRAAMTEGRTTFHVVPPAVRIDAPALFVTHTVDSVCSDGPWFVLQVRSFDLPGTIVAGPFADRADAWRVANGADRVKVWGGVARPAFMNSDFTPANPQRSAPRLSELADGLGRPTDAWHSTYRAELVGM